MPRLTNEMQARYRVGVSQVWTSGGRTKALRTDERWWHRGAPVAGEGRRPGAVAAADLE